MTRAFWHRVRLRISPYWKVLVGMLFVTSPMLWAAFQLAESHPAFDKWIFLFLWMAAIALFWNVGLLFILLSFPAPPPQPPATPLARLVYSCNGALASISAVFFTFWFAGLVLFTFVGPILILVSPAR